MSQSTVSDFNLEPFQKPQVATEIVLDSSASYESDTASNEPSAKRGRKVENPVWDYYTKENNPTKISICQVQISNGEKCGHSINGWYATNAIYHLRGKHVKKFREFEEKLELKTREKQKKEIDEEMIRQKNFDEPHQFSTPNHLILSQNDAKYDPQNLTQQRYNIKLAIMFACLNIPLSLIEKVEFYFNFLIYFILIIILGRIYCDDRRSEPASFSSRTLRTDAIYHKFVPSYESWN